MLASCVPCKACFCKSAVSKPLMIRLRSPFGDFAVQRLYEPPLDSFGVDAMG